MSDLAEKLSRAYYYTELGGWLGPEVDDDERWRAVASAAESHAAAMVARERERCAKLCEEIEASVWRTYKNGGGSNQHTEGRSDGAGECAAAIRATPTEPSK